MSDFRARLPEELPDGSVIRPGAIANPDQPVRLYVGDLDDPARIPIGHGTVGWTDVGLVLDATLEPTGETWSGLAAIRASAVTQVSLDFTMTPKSSRRLARLLFGLNRRQWAAWRARRLLARLQAPLAALAAYRMRGRR